MPRSCWDITRGDLGVSLSFLRSEFEENRAERGLKGEEVIRLRKPCLDPPKKRYEELGIQT